VPFHPRLEDVARAFAAYAAIAVRSARLEELSFKDPLTDGYNRRYLMLRLYEEVSRASRYSQPLSLILLDPARPRRLQGHQRQMGPRRGRRRPQAGRPAPGQPVAP